MTHAPFTRVPLWIATGLCAAGLVMLSSCSAQEATTPNAAPATSAASTTAAGAPATSAPATTTTAVAKEIGNPEIKAALSVSHPELWALVNYDYMSWDAFGGFNIPVPTGTDPAKAIALCDEVAKLVYEGSPKTPIVVAVGVSADDIKGKPLVERKSKEGTCAAV